MEAEYQRRSQRNNVKNVELLHLALSYLLGSFFFYKNMVVIYVFLLEEAMYSYCYLCILIVSLCYSCLCILRRGYPD